MSLRQDAPLEALSHPCTFALRFECAILARRLTNTSQCPWEDSMKRWRHAAVIGLALLALYVSPRQTRASEFAVSQYGRVTATLPWAVALKMGYFKDEGINIDKIISGKGGGTTLRNMLASDLPFGEVAFLAVLVALCSGVVFVFVFSVCVF